MSGPLAGLKVVEMVGIGPGPFAAMLLADMGAEVIRVDQPRTGPLPDPYSALNTRFDVQARGRRSIAVNLKSPAGANTVMRLIEQADGLIEGYRPGVMERLGLGPQDCLARNPRLVYGRMTGWGQDGPLAQTPGHDINYIALSGALAAMGDPDRPPRSPTRFSGGMLLAFGLVCALLETRRSGTGQVVDAAMTDGAALMSAMMYGMKAAGQWSNQRGENLLDGGAFFYDTYACADGRFVAVGAIEPQFYALLRERCGIADDPAFNAQRDRAAWPLLKLRLAEVFRTRTRDAWCALLEGCDACFAPVLDWDEAPGHTHNQARQTFCTLDGVVQPAPAPRFARTPAAAPVRSTTATADEVLARWATAASKAATA